MLSDIAELANWVGDLVVQRRQLEKLRQKSDRIFRYLTDKGYVRAVGAHKVRVTDAGKIKILHELVKRRKPDGQMRIIIFDIPETMRSQRNAFRRHLVSLGFTMEQQSVWVSRLPCDDLVRLVVDYHGLGKFVSLIVGRLAP